ncbi:MAG TPA: ATP-binding protein [Bacillota bacterium]|nr:ATP-binding protein [Bacillota bacterium]
MKQLLILSGKGGTGKTTIASSFIKLSKAKAFADCDVEAPNLHLLNPSGEKTSELFYGMKKARIDIDRCKGCGLCQTYCRFDAIHREDVYSVDIRACEGCSVCQLVCPENAIEMIDSVDGETSIYRGKHLFSTAELNMGSGNSGKLVTKVKQNLKDNLNDEELVIIDGAPGIGCPVIASLSGVDMVLIVAEPSMSGISDMERIIQTAMKFKTKTAVCVNKYDTNIALTRKIEKYISGLNIAFIGVVPYDENVIKTINSGHTVVEGDSEASKAIKKLYETTLSFLNY